MPSFGGTLQERMPARSLARSYFPVMLAAAAIGVLACALVIGSSNFSSVEEADLLSNDSKLGVMQREVQQQLVDAAKRRATASKHKAQAVQLQAKAEEDTERALLLHKQAELANKEAVLRRSAQNLADAKRGIKKLDQRAADLDATADKDKAKADQDKEEILELEDQAGTFSEQAGAEADKIKVVQAAQAKTASALPGLMKNAEAAEEEAQRLKQTAAEHMRESSSKTAQASKLDKLAQDKENQAHMMRNRLMAVLQQKAKTLEEKQKEASEEEDRAKQGAKEAALEAEKLASNAEQQASMAQAAESLASQRLPAERAALDLVGRDNARQVVHTTAKAKMQALHEAAAAPKPVKVEQADPHPAVETEEEEPDHKAIDERRKNNLKLAALHSEKLRAANALADDASGDDTAVREDEDGHLQLAVHRQPQLVEDGHYSRREEAFKAALAAAYRKGYTQELSEQDGDKENARKPARMQMLGDTEMLQKGPGSNVHLEKDSDKGVFSMLWGDSSLAGETRSLEHGTQRLQKLAPRRRESQGPDLAHLYEDGHTSREEQAFSKSMAKYRTALRQERSAALAKAQRDTQDLSQLPSGDVRGYERRRSADLHDQMHRVQSVLLAQPHDHWEVPERHGGEVRVREDEDGHLVLEHDAGRESQLDEVSDDEDRDRDYARRDDRRDEDDEEPRRGDELSTSRRGRLHRIEEELRDSRERERRLESRTERLQGEVDVLTGPRTQSLSMMPRREELRGREEYRGRDGHDYRREGGRREVGRGEGREESRDEAHRQRNEQIAKAGGKHFSADNQYEKEYAKDPGHVSVAEIKFQHALKSFDRTKDILREGAIQDQERGVRLPELVPAHLPGQGL